MRAYVDSHIHLSDAAYSDELEHVVRHMERLDIAACAVSMDRDDAARTLEISKMSDCILPFVGLHPERANDGGGMIDDTLCDLISLAESNREDVAGIGEIGLDPTYADDGRIPAAQVRAFEAMLELAARLDKPVSIHSRRSLDRVLDVMTSFDPRRASLHWFDGGKKHLARVLDMGFYVSYGPVSVYANDKQALMALSDMDRILVETDGPVTFSGCFERKMGQSCFVASVINTVAGAHHVQFDHAADLIARNSADYLRM